jgi:hypothetical protein
MATHDLENLRRIAGDWHGGQGSALYRFAVGVHVDASEIELEALYTRRGAARIIRNAEPELAELDRLIAFAQEQQRPAPVDVDELERERAAAGPREE